MSKSDKTLSTHGTNQSYWYSVYDGHILSRVIRKELLSTYYNGVVLGGDADSSIRFNSKRIFVSEPYYHQLDTNTFKEYLNSDIQKIVGEVGTTPWDTMPIKLIIPFLSLKHWRVVVAEIDYGERGEDANWTRNPTINITINDPYGETRVSDTLLQYMKEAIVKYSTTLLRKNHDDNTARFSDTHIYSTKKVGDQQGIGKNGWDCGPITFQNVRDYISQAIVEMPLQDFTGFTVQNHEHETHDSVVTQTRRNHVIEFRTLMVGEAVLEDCTKKSKQISSKLDLDITKDKEKYSDKKIKLDAFVSSLSPEEQLEFFTMLDAVVESKKAEKDTDLTRNEYKSIVRSVLQSIKHEGEILIRQLEVQSSGESSSYSYSYSEQKLVPAKKKLFSPEPQEQKFVVGNSDCELFKHTVHGNIEKLKAVSSEVIVKTLDSNGNNILHYACFTRDIELIKYLIARLDVDDITAFINHRNNYGTNPLGMTFLFPSDNFLSELEIAKIFVQNHSYRINSYLNDKVYMDYATVHEIGGTNILHNVILIASRSQNLDGSFKSSLIKFFHVLNKRLADEVSDYEYLNYFNPNYPTMNPGKLLPEIDGHMLSTRTLYEKCSAKFKSRDLKQICAKYLKIILDFYEIAQHDDSSGDSEDEGSYAFSYKKMYLDFIDHVYDEDFLGELGASLTSKRIFAKYDDPYTICPEALVGLTFTDGKYDEAKWCAMWKTLNTFQSSTPLECSKYKSLLDSFVVPLFHGVPFMKSQYTNYERRKIAEKIFEINKKLLGKFSTEMSAEESKLSDEEKVIMGIHSRTATASAGLQSLYEIVVADEEKLKKLDAVDQKLEKYFTRVKISPGFSKAMKDYIFNFATSPIKSFWEENNDGVLPDEGIVKYRFPVIATSKAADHAVRFAIGRNVEGVRGESRMEPEYDDSGHPSHRLAGLIYITFHKLSDLFWEQNHYHTGIDVNHAVNTGSIKKGQGAIRFENQVEYDFLGKIDSERVVAIVPILYPKIRDVESHDSDFHSGIWGLDHSARTNTNISPVKIKKDVSGTPSPDIMTTSTNLSGFGKMFVPAMIDLINGIACRIANYKKCFLVMIKANNELVPYPVGMGDKDFSEAQKELQKISVLENKEFRLWQAVLEADGDSFDNMFSSMSIGEASNIGIDLFV